MSMDGGFQAVRAAGANLQIRTLLKNKCGKHSLGWWKIKKKD
jgi:hypothetical protein